MKLALKVKYLFLISMGLVVFIGGCGTVSETASMKLRFAANDSTTYKSIIDKQMSLRFQGGLSDVPKLKDGKNYNVAEIIFTQDIESVDADGVATARITIKQLKCVSVHKDEPLLDYDSTRQADSDSPLAGMIDQSYIIKITPSGEVSSISGIKKLRSRFRGSSAANKAGMALLKNAALRERHEIIALMAASGKEDAAKGDSWSKIKTFSFPIMGNKTYERIYTFTGVKNTGEGKIAKIDMKAIPSAETGDEAPEISGPFSNMFDNLDSYVGELRLNVDSGKVEKYFEKLESEWLMVDPLASDEGAEQSEAPDSITMGAVRHFSLERIK